MDHLAILSKEKKLLDLIISGKKTIESRWYEYKRTPYQNISAGEIVYFKEVGEPVIAKALVDQVLFFDQLDEVKIRSILEKYGKHIGIPISSTSKYVGKNYCTLVFLSKARKIEPFHINKKGFGSMAAWITVKTIEDIKESHQAQVSRIKR